jgi:hypothetical protein
MKSKGLTPERLERIKQIITENKEKETEKKFNGGCLKCDFQTDNRDELAAHNCEQLIKFIVTAKLLNTYEIEVMATDAAAAIASLDEWVAEDFEDYLENQQWDMETC